MNDRKLLTDKAVQDIVVENKLHSDISPLVMKSLSLKDFCRDAGFSLTSKKALSSLVKQGKLNIGVHYAIKKLRAVCEEKDPDAGRELAKDIPLNRF